MKLTVGAAVDPDGVGDGLAVAVGAGVGLGLGLADEPTTTLCSTLATCPRASVTDNRTYLVPTPWKVKLIVGPLPRLELSASSVQP